MSSDELMFMNWREMIKPNKIEIDSTDSYGKFVCEPLERGFGITIGNSLRRIILSSLYGAAVTSVRIEGVMHEFSVVQNVQHVLDCHGKRRKQDDASDAIGNERVALEIRAAFFGSTWK